MLLDCRSTVLSSYNFSGIENFEKEEKNWYWYFFLSIHFSILFAIFILLFLSFFSFFHFDFTLSRRPRFNIFVEAG